MTSPDTADDLAWIREDLAYHQLRVLLLVTAVSDLPGHQRKLDGLTKLAKLDFLLRYPALASDVLDDLALSDRRLGLSNDELNQPTQVTDPMVRYKFGPWDDRYYPVIGALVGRGLVRYARGRKGSVALVPTPAGRRLAGELSESSPWRRVADRSRAIADASQGLTGNALKDLIYDRLPELMDRPHRQVIK